MFFIVDSFKSIGIFEPNVITINNFLYFGVFGTN